MADTSQVEAALVGLLGQAIYPNGPYLLNSAGNQVLNAEGQPIPLGNIVGAPVSVQRGWPTEADIRVAVKSGLVLVRVHAIGGVSKDVTRFPRIWLDQPQLDVQVEAIITNTIVGGLVSGSGSPILTGGGSPIVTGGGEIAGYDVTFSGTVVVGQFIGVESQGVGYTYVVQAGDTLASIAHGLAVQIPSADSIGAVLQLPTWFLPPEAFVEQSGPSIVEAAREQQMFVAAVWAPSPALRDSTLQLLLPAAAYTYRLTLPDGTIATLMDIQATGPDDEPGRAGEWRRDLRLNYDYPVVLSSILPPVTIPILNLTQS